MDAVAEAVRGEMKMPISEAKMRIVIENYFKSECDMNTSIRSAFEKGFRLGVKKGQSVNTEPVKHGKWIIWDEIIAGIYHTVSECSECGFTTDKMQREEMPYCPHCGARMDSE